jgi:glutathione synthase
MIERSKAIKCPSIQMHLTGCKVVQSIMARPNVVEKYVKSEEAAKCIRKTFVDIYDINVN